MGSLETVIFGGGCFWCTEAIFKSLKGVISVIPGYSGGEMDNPSYEKISGGKTGHAECIKIKYDPTIISFQDLLAVFFNTHNPTTPNQQGADVGTQYRSVIFYTTEKQKEEAEKLIKELSESQAYGPDKKVVTEVKPRYKFFPAESYHQNYYENNVDAPYCQIVIAPKLEKLNKKFKELIK